MLVKVKRLIIVLLALFCFQSNADNCLPKNIYYQSTNDEQLLIINLRINGISVMADMDAYRVNNRLLLPLSVLTDVLKLAISKQNDQLSGQFLTDNCTFNGSLITQSKQHSSASWLWSKDEFDDYIDIAIFNKLLGNEAEFNYSLQQLVITTTLKLDILEQAQNSSKQAQKKTVTPADLIIDDEFDLINYPIISYNIDQRFRSTSKDFTTNLRLNSFFDLFGQSAELRLNRNNSKENRFLKISRLFTLSTDREPNNVLYYELGDIQSQRDDLIQTANLGAGFSISNSDPYYNDSFSTITITEPTLPGWRAELYRNGQFIDEVATGDDNRVVFNNVDTFYGQNLFAIKLFGPEGQQITRNKKIVVGNNQLGKNRWNYKLEYLDTNGRFIDKTQQNSANIERSAKAMLSYGLTNNITLDAGSQYIRENGNDHYYLTSSLHGNVFAQSLNMQLAKDLTGGNAFFTGWAGELSTKTKFKVDYNYFDNFVSGLYTSTNNTIKSQLNIKFNGVTDYLNGLSWSSFYRDQQEKSGASQKTANVAVTKGLTSGTLSSSILYNNYTGTTGAINRVYWTYNAQPWRLSTSLDWFPFDHGKIRLISSELRWPQYRKIYNQTLLQYNPSQKAKYSINHNLTFRNNRFNFQLISQIDDQGDWQFSAGISGTLSFDYVNNNLVWSQPQALNSGLIETQVYFDENRNQVFDQNEQALANVEFSGNYQWKALKTNNQGKILLPSTLNGQKLSIKTQTLPDPYLQPQFKNIKIFTHKGGINNASLAVVAINDIEGTIYQISANKTRAAAKQTIILTNDTGEEVAKTQSEFDGYFIFDQVPPGSYFITISSAAISNNNLTILNLPKKIIASKMGDSIVLADILLVDQQYLSKAVTKEQNQAQPSENEEAFFVQLGVYKYYDSVSTAAKSLPADLVNVRIYYNKQRFRYYLVAGPYPSSLSTQKLLSQLTHIEQFKQGFLVRAQRYFNHKWALIYQLSGLQRQLTASYDIINKAEEQSYFCQLASYQSLISIDPKKLQAGILVTKRKVKNRDYYSFIAGPFIDSHRTKCQDQRLQNLTPETPIVKLTAVLQLELEHIN